MTLSALKALISAIEAGPVTRELSDRVLLAIGWSKKPSRLKTGNKEWHDPGGNFVCLDYPRELKRALPDPLTNLHDAQLAVPPGWITMHAGQSPVSGTWYWALAQATPGLKHLIAVRLSMHKATTKQMNPPAPSSWPV